jgi:hypothetical protein
MEAIPILLTGIFVIFLFVISIIILFKGLIRKNKNEILLGIFSSFLIIVITSIVILDIKLISAPTQNEILGKYIISESNRFISETELKNYILELKENGEFTMSKNQSGILCERGKYEVDFDNKENEIGFKCGKGWSMKAIEWGIFGHKIVFRDGTRFEKFE